jgi:dienelactone hydrolase
MSLLLDHIAGWTTHVPPTWDAAHLAEPGLRGVFFESVPFRGSPTRVFAWIGVPPGADAARPVPGMVLIHGGGGSAFARWVRWWNRRGYAAIAMDTCGAMPLPNTGIAGSADWPRHSFSGPRGWGGFDQGDWPPTDQWSFHAAAAIVKAHTLLAAQPGVDPGRIGVTGVSWGGFLTSLAAGLDPRFRCAMPVYGCGFIHAASCWMDNAEFTKLAPAARRFWIENWEPSVLLPRAACPMLWLNGTNDFAYYPPVWQRSASATRGPRLMCLKLRYPHGHIPAAEEAPELAAFADACLREGPPLPAFDPPALDCGVLRACVRSPWPLRAVSLLMTPGTGAWPEREWFHLPATLDEATGTASAAVPADATAACLSGVTDNWLTATSDLVFPKA